MADYTLVSTAVLASDHGTAAQYNNLRTDAITHTHSGGTTPVVHMLNTKYLEVENAAGTTKSVLGATAGDVLQLGASGLVLSLINNAATLTLPTATGILATLAGAEELTNKTLTSSVLKGTYTASGTVTLPALTLGGTVTLNGQQFSGAASFSAGATFGGGLSGVTTASMSGSLTFNSTAQRISADFSNATLANRLTFQTSTLNGSTIPACIPNGAGTISGWHYYVGADPDNGGRLGITVSAVTAGFVTSKTGSGTEPTNIVIGCAAAQSIIIDTSDGSIATSAKLTPKASASGGAGFNLASGAAPASPAIGDFWFDGTNLKFRDAGGTSRTLNWT